MTNQELCEANISNYSNWFMSEVLKIASEMRILSKGHFTLCNLPESTVWNLQPKPLFSIPFCVYFSSKRSSRHLLNIKESDYKVKNEILNLCLFIIFNFVFFSFKDKHKYRVSFLESTSDYMSLIPFPLPCLLSHLYKSSQSICY